MYEFFGHPGASFETAVICSAFEQKERNFEIRALDAHTTVWMFKLIVGEVSW
jgi:hypothetical protein